jgi:hypothetical protein
MKRNIVVTVCLLTVMSLAPSITYAQAIPTEVEWIRQFGGEGRGQDKVEAIAVHDGVYVAGSAGGALVANTAETGAFVRKYDASGAELWTRQFADAGTGVTGIAVSDSSTVEQTCCCISTWRRPISTPASWKRASWVTLARKSRSRGAAQCR